MKFEKNVNEFLAVLVESHDGQFDEYLKGMAVADLLDRLGAENGSPELYQKLEQWIKDTYSNHVIKDDSSLTERY